MKKAAIFTLVILSASACAKQPEAIEAAQLNDNLYSGFSCARLAAEELQVTQSIEALSAQQSSAASSDALGVFLLGLPLSSMGGGDQEAKLSIAKGQKQVIDRLQLEKKCS